MVRYYICPLEQVAVGLKQFWQPRVANYPTNGWAVAENGGAWCLAYVDADDFSAADQDANCIDLFESLMDASGAASPRELRQWLAARTVGDIPAAARTRIQTRLTSRGIDLGGITLQSTLEDLLLRVLRFFSPNGNLRDLGVSRS